MKWEFEFVNLWHTDLGIEWGFCPISINFGRWAVGICIMNFMFIWTAISPDGYDHNGRKKEIPHE